MTTLSLKPAAMILALAFLVTGCKSARKVNPDTFPGWHNANYSDVFGRLQRIPAVNPENPPVWVVRFGLAGDLYHGEFAITPPERLTGYSGGELVEITGTVRPELSYPTYTGTWYEVRNIRMFADHR